MSATTAGQGVNVIPFAGSHLSAAWERVHAAAAIVEEFWAHHPRPSDGRPLTVPGAPRPP